MIGVFFWGGGRGGEERTPDTVTSQVVCHPLKLKYLSAFVLSCDIYRKFKRFATKAAIIEMYLSTLQISRQAGNVKLIQ